MKPNRFHFRAWDKQLNRMLLDAEIGDSCSAGTTLADLFFNVNPERVTWMQSTGFCDKNGKEIFEGDVVSDGYSTGTISWEDSVLGYSVRLRGTSKTGHVCCWGFQHWHMIGNIYENPELISVK